MRRLPLSIYERGNDMRLQILGTAAGEAWPAIFCGCDTCKRAQAAGGKDLRSRSSLQINDIYKIDLPPDTYHHIVTQGLNLSRLSHLFITHSHSDHFDLALINMMNPPFAHNLEHAPVKILGNNTVIEKINAAFNESDLSFNATAIEPFVPVAAGELAFTPILAAHMTHEDCLNYVISSEEATVLYASDTGAYPERTINYLCKLKFDLLVIECTSGTLNIPPTVHMNFETVLDLVNRLKSAGAVSSRTRVVITHFSHNMGLLHKELEAIAKPHNIEVAYDGIVLDI
jgi:phosphoribosyl 1,2-cyclic phosphate phosphodiesterase